MGMFLSEFYVYMQCRLEWAPNMTVCCDKIHIYIPKKAVDLLIPNLTGLHRSWRCLIIIIIITKKFPLVNFNFTNIHVTMMKFGTWFRGWPPEPCARFHHDSYCRNEVILGYVLTEFRKKVAAKRKTRENSYVRQYDTNEYFITKFGICIENNRLQPYTKFHIDIPVL